MTLEERMTLFRSTDLYVVITEAFCAGRRAVEILAKVLEAGVRAVQLREKEMNDGALYDLALKFRELTTRNNALLLINDRIDIALATGADGVHLGQDDFPIEAARRLASEMIVGCSTHSLSEAVSGQRAGASYVNIGPIFATQTKSGTVAALGPEIIDAVRPHLAIPWTVMGGIKESNIAQVLKRGAKHVAVVTAVTAADDVSAACTVLREKIRNT
ncbi:MAG: thiamine phosphate synthase [Desulfomonilaceae bacterium]